MMNASNRILICTPSNMAADQVARMLKNCFCGVMDESNVLRLRSPGNDYEGRDREFDAIIACDDELKTYIIPRELEEYRVVICTLGCSAHLAKRDNMKGFFRFD
jgi:hypothetical protein